MRNIVIAVLIVVAIGGFLYWYAQRETSPAVVAQPDVPMVQDLETDEQPDPPPEPEQHAEGGPSETQPPEPLPALGESDAYVADLWKVLTPEPLTSRIEGAKHLVRRTVAATDVVARSHNPYKQIYMFRPAGEFRTERRGDRTYLAVENYARFDALVDAVNQIDPSMAASYYNRLEPLIEAAYAELANPDRTWPDTLSAAIDEVLTAQVPPTPPELVGQKGIFIFKDPELEDQTAIQKLLIRMGPDNAKACQDALRAFRDQLD